MYNIVVVDRVIDHVYRTSYLENLLHVNSSSLKESL